MPIRGLKEANAKIREFVRRVPRESVVELHRNICAFILFGVVHETPVQFGWARGAWIVSLESPSYDVPSEPKRARELSSSEAGALAKKVIEEGNKKIEQVSELGHVIWIQNNVFYIEFLEEGTERMDPFAMLGRTLSLLNEWIDDQTRKIEAKYSERI